ncbi:hypothetical protein FBU30_001332 [Linnemannia zychae]|nr:hypothetical protein FBU30_001332 [Linnemannia zychae]
MVCIHSEASKAPLIDIYGDFLDSIGGCQDKNYGAIVNTKDRIEDISGYTLRITVQKLGPELGDTVDKFVQYDLDG